MFAQLVVAVVVVTLDGGFLDCAVHPFDLAAPRENSPPDCFRFLVAARVVGFDQPVLDPVDLGDHVKAHRPGMDRVAVSRLLGELNAPRHWA